MAILGLGGALMQDLVILIPAAGRSSRMRGADKLAEPVDGIPLLRAQALKALSVSDRVHVVLPSLDHPRAKLLDGLPVTIAVAPDASEGLGGSLRNAGAQLAGAAAVMILLADLAMITAEDLRTLATARLADPDHLIWRGTTQTGQPGHPIIFAGAVLPAFAALSGDHGAEAIVRAHKDQTMFVPLAGDHARFDLDTPKDWATFRANTGR
jgi:molybdenum cofactor cytidylyltransferase